MIRRFAAGLAIVSILTFSLPAFAASKGGFGTGSKGSSSRVSGYTTKTGKSVSSYRKTTPDGTQKNNYSAKGNYNPSTGKVGTKIPKK